MRLFVGVLALCLFVLPPAHANPQREAMLAQAQRSVVIIDASAAKTVDGDVDGAAFSRRPGEQQLGSGFVVDSAKGHIVTTLYVVDSDAPIRVRRADGVETPAKVIGQDEETGLALLQVDLAGAPALAWANEPARTGQDVFVMGGVYNLGVMATTGMVSSGNPDLSRLKDDTPSALFFVDAVVHKGVGGGPILDAQGRVVGVAYAQYGASFAAADRNLGVGVRAAEAAVAVAAMQAGRVAPRSWIGLFYQQFAGSALVTEVVKGSPAAEAGVRQDDRIVAVDGAPVPANLARVVRGRPPGDTITFTIERAGRRTLDRRDVKVLTRAQ